MVMFFIGSSVVAAGFAALARCRACCRRGNERGEWRWREIGIGLIIIGGLLTFVKTEDPPPWNYSVPAQRGGRVCSGYVPESEDICY